MLRAKIKTFRTDTRHTDECGNTDMQEYNKTLVRQIPLFFRSHSRSLGE